MSKPPRVALEIEKAFARAHAALPPMRAGARLLLGCSAGGDSMALLDLCSRAAEERRWALTVAHLDHAQRVEGAAEAAFVVARCRELGVALIEERFQGGSGLAEAQLREARLEFFRRAMAQTEAEALVLAHQADDRAETFLMRLIAGAGPTGLSSIRTQEELEGLLIVRPLLAIRREALRDYLGERGLAWRDDPSNADPARKRAWVRTKILPLLDERMGIEVAPRIARASELAEEESAALTQACEILLAQLVAPESPPAAESLALGHPIWKKAAPGLRRRLMRQWLWKLGGRPHPPNYGAVEEALKFAARAARGSELRTIELIHLLKIDSRLVAYPPGEAAR